MSIEAMKQALEALDGLSEPYDVLKAQHALRTAIAKAEKQEPVAWQPIETAPKGKIVLIHYKNRLGNGRTMRARYYLPETLDSDTTESGWADEGWYEESEAYEYLMPLDGEPTHWMQLPSAPGATPPAAQRQPLTEWQIIEIKAAIKGTLDVQFIDFARAIEAAHGITGEQA
jgi:hypothetical protein